MNISLENIDKLNGVITAVIEPADYENEYTKKLKELKQKVREPGFRPGMVPVGLLKKKYGKEVMAEVVNTILQDKLFAYIRDNKVNMLGEPLPMEQEAVSLEEGDSFTFKFELALAPEFKVELDSADSLPYYEVEVSDEMIQRQVEMYQQRGGTYQKVLNYQDNDMLKGTLTELNEDGTDKPEGIVVEEAVLLPKYLKNEEQKALFNDAKPQEKVVFNPAKAYEDNEAGMASLLNVKKEELGEHQGDFRLDVNEITRFMPGPLDKTLFDEVYPGADIKTPEEFTAKIKETIQKQFDKDAEYKFLLDMRKYITEKVGKLEFPDEKLKRIMTANAKGDSQKVEDNYDKSIEELKWHLIKEQLVEQNGVKVDDNDVMEMARETTRMQFAQYGMLNIPQEYLEDSVKEMLKKRETVDNLIDRCIEMKLAQALKQKVTLELKTVSAEEFNKMFD